MKLEFKVLDLKKRFPLAISRGTYAGSENLFVGVSHEGYTGWGEMSPGASEGAASAEEGRRIIEDFLAVPLEPEDSVQSVYQRGRIEGVAPCALAALEMALWDLLAKRAGLPLYRLLGLGRPTVPTSVTIGINPPEVVRERIPLLLDGTSIRSLKIKLGSPDGVDADRDMFQAVFEETRNRAVSLRVDANGGWSLDDARAMMKWLADRGVDYIEQPLPRGAEDQLPELFKNRALPVYVDESCRFAEDITAWADAVDGVNLKLMKCGGITEAIRIVAVCRAFNLHTMIGCMGESSMSISAGAAIGALFDHIDLDSHLNLAPDPCTGAELRDGVLMPPDKPGHGAEFVDA